MEVNVKQARDLLKSLGYPKAATWVRSILSAKINKLSTIEGVSQVLENPDLNSLKEAILQASSREEKVEIAEPSKAASNGHSKAPGRPSKAKRSSPGRGEPRKPKAANNGSGRPFYPDRNGVDRFGCRRSSRQSLLNECISKTPKSLRQLTEEAYKKYPDKIDPKDFHWVHLDQYAKKGKIQKIKKGWKAFYCVMPKVAKEAKEAK